MQLDLRNLVQLAYPELAKDRYSIFTDQQVEELNNLIKYADYYENNVFKYITQKYPEYKYDETKTSKPANIPINYSRKVVNELAKWQFEEDIDFEVTATDKRSESKAADIEAELYDIHKHNKMEIKNFQAAQEANISGGVAYKLVWDDGAKMPRILVRPRMECFPVTDFDDYEKLEKVHFVAFRDEDTVWKQTYQMVGGKCQVEEALYSVKERLKKIKVIQEPTFLADGKIDFLPVYIIPNMPTIGMVWGYSELADLIPIIDEINKKYSDASDALRFEMFAITILLNMKNFASKGRDPDRPKMKAGAVWELIGGPGDVKSDAFKLESNFRYTEAFRQHMEGLKATLYELSNVVQLEGERLKSIGNLSGVALKLMFAAVASKTNLKNKIWRPKLVEIYEGALKFTEAYGGKNYNLDKFDIDVLFHLPIPQNEKERVEIATTKLAAGLSSIETEMNKLGVEDTRAEMAKILEEQKEQDKAMSDIYGPGKDQD